MIFMILLNIVIVVLSGKFIIWTHLSFQDVVFQWLTSNDIQLDNIDAEDPEVFLFLSLVI